MKTQLIMMCFLLFALVNFSCQMSDNGIKQKEEQVPQRVAMAMQILDRYIAVHNDIFKAAPRRVIPVPGVFEPIDWQKQLIELQSMKMSLKTLSHTPKDNFNSNEFNNAFTAYCSNLLNTISALEKIASQLRDKTINLDQYKAKDYQRDIERYESMREQQRKSGAELNQIYRSEIAKHSTISK